MAYSRLMGIIVSPQLDQEGYQAFREAFPGGEIEAFASLSAPLVRRVMGQMGRSVPNDAFLEAFLTRIWELAAVVGFPEALPSREVGTPGLVDDERMERLNASLWQELPWHAEREALSTLAYQLFLTLLMPEFRACRQSYLETGVEGCPRQDAAFCADRLSGSHCEDCPYFTAMSSEKHRKLLGKQWLAGADALEADWGRFLPEDFRLLRVFLHLHRRFKA